MQIDPAEVAARCVALLREGRAGEAAPLLAPVRERLRSTVLPLKQAEKFARRVVAAHLEAVEAEAGALVPALWRGGLGAPVFELLLDVLQYAAVDDEPLEWSCTDLREELLDAVAKLSTDPAMLDLASALAVQAFRMEYVLAESRAEDAAVGKLRAEVEDALTRGAGVAPLKVAILAQYRPLHRLAHADRIPALAKADSARFAVLLQVQVLEPLAEAAIRPTIRALTPIADQTSQAVQEQYEENPYPRWHRLPVAAGPGGGEDDPAADAGAPRARHLIAGCGTGRQVLSAAMAAPGTHFSAVDLSRVSLAYAIRKAKEHGVANVDFAHADILALPESGLAFDFISCVGVIHHMRDPALGLRALRRLMAHASGLKVAVYTESGRQGIVAGIRLREQYALPPTAEGIREFRQMVAAQPEGHPVREIMRYGDFYSLSGCRDLIFHVMEHRYTIPAFVAMAAREGMRVQAIQPPEQARARFVAQHPDPAALADLDAWHRFETENPGVFGSMYRFLLEKA